METPVLVLYQMPSGLFGSISLNPPSPPLTVCHSGGEPPRSAGEPLSCSPPSNTFWFVGCCEKETISESEPIFVSRLSKTCWTLQVPSPLAPFSERYTPPSLTKYIWSAL